MILNGVQQSLITIKQSYNKVHASCIQQCWMMWKPSDRAYLAFNMLINFVKIHRGHPTGQFKQKFKTLFSVFAGCFTIF